MRRKHAICPTDWSMANLLRQTFLLPAILICVALAAQQGCQENPPIKSWDSPRMLKIQKEWESLLDTANKTPGQEAVEKYGGKNEKLDDMLEGILRKHLSKQDLCHLAATCGTLPVRAKDRSEFANAVLAYMERTFIDPGDRDNLVKLLSTRCQLRICGYDDIEFYLALRGRRLKDPILVLGEAFSKCKVPDVRHDIAGAVRRGFVGLGIHGKDDAEFVNNAMQWYEKEKGHLTVNQMYWRNTMGLPADTYDLMPELYDKVEKSPAAYRIELLFKKKPSGK